MSLSARDRLGPYEILAPLGAGGMGEVYRARDTKLGREVAIKVLPGALADDPERLARFEREAKVLASLNHPHIAQIYGLEDSVSMRALVMELVPGHTLKGPLPLETALDYAKQIASALEAAHEKGITHRDLKPANIMITPQGVAKVLDFGLAALPAENRSGGSALSNSPTVTLSPTRAGVILGTAAYMSPEQAAGSPVDKRADIWSFGVVLWEMLTGEPLFQGETVSHILAAVLKDEPDFGKVPAKVRPLLRHCLQRDPKKRLRDISGVDLLLEQPPAPVPLAGTPPPSRIWMIIAGLCSLAAIGVGMVALRRAPEEPRVAKLLMAIPDKANFGIRGSTPQISPDGRRVVFAPLIDGKTDLWVRDLDSLGLRMLPGTTGASFPFWAPDSRWVGFFTLDKLKKVDVTGGPPVTICDVSEGRGGTWNQDGVIVYGTLQDGTLRVPAAGGTPAAIHTGGIGHVERFPWFLPDGRHFLYAYTDGGIHLDSMDARPGSPPGKKILDVDSNPVYVPPFGSAPGYLLFLRDRTLMAQPFDTSKLQVTGDPMPVAERVAFVSPPAAGQFSASQNGILVYAPETPRNKQLTWLDRSGKPVGTLGPPADTLSAVISPDGSSVAADPMNLETNSRNVWRYDVIRATASRLTFIPIPNGAGFPVWSPDGNRIAFTGNYSQPYLKSTSDAGPEKATDQTNLRIWDWSRDGRWLIAGRGDPKTRIDIWLIPQFGDKKPFVYLNGDYDEQDAKLSPNGQWLAYASNESQRFEIYVQTFPDHRGKWQISNGGGRYPVWSRDGRELYYLSAARKMMAVEVSGDGKNFMPRAPQALFDAPAPAPFDVAKDGRFLIQVPVDPGSANVPLTVITNWQAGLKK